MQNTKNIDLVAQFRKENVDFSKIEKARASRTVVNSGLEVYTGTWGTAQKKHLLNRVLTGYANRHLLDLNNLSLQKSLDLIFSPEKQPSVPVNDYDYEITKEETEKQGFLYIEPGKEYAFAPEPKGAPGPRYNSHEAWLYRNMIQQSTSIHWRMVFFLKNLLVASGGSVKMLYQYYMLLFNSSFKSYKSTLYKITLDPMMLDYLNLQNSHKNKPDENYARELQELFTVGKGPNSQYTEDDVSTMARLLVGWAFDYESKEKINGPITTSFNAINHDTSDKQFSAFYGNRVIKGREGQDGEKELDEAIDMIFSTNECAMYLCRRLYQFFCYPIINDTVEKNVIVPMADLLRKNNYELMVPLRTLLGSAHFFDTSFYSSMIKSPIEFMFGFYKEFDLNLLNTTTGGDIPKKFTDPLTANFYKFKNLQWEMSNIGLNFTNPPSVSGWPAYYQAPVYDLFWINSDTIAKRSNSGNAIAKWGLYIGSGDIKGNIHLQIDKIKFVSSLKSPDNIDLVIDETVERIMCAPISDKAKARIKASVLAGNAASYYTQLYQSHMSKPSEETRSTLSNRLENLFGALFQMGEIHLY
jgi:uncharacterized protein (DUF1800 family)